MTETQLLSTLPLLQKLEGLDAQATGAVLVSRKGHALGAIFLEGGRPCWARSNQRASRLSRLLVEESGGHVTEGELSLCYERCREQGLSLMSALSEECSLDRGTLRRALLRETAESVRTLAAQATGVRFVPHREGSYGPDFRFSTLEVLLAPAGEDSDPAVLCARQLLSRVATDDTCGVAFRLDEWDVPIAAAGQDCPNSLEMGALSEWAKGALEVNVALLEEQSVLVLGSDELHSVLLWQDHGIAFVVLCDGVQAVARALSRVGQSRRPGRPDATEPDCSHRASGDSQLRINV